ncbi:MAG: N-acetylglucosamine-6-phosphate deacetylase [Acidobacteriaceae bacterium]
MSTVLTAATLLTPLTEIDHPQVTIEDGLILSIESRGALEAPGDAQRLDYAGDTLAPAYFDVHTHGAMGHDVMEGTGEAFDAIGNFLAEHGVGAYLPTTVTAPVEATLRSLEEIAKQIARAVDAENYRGARPVGIHLEGPFLSHGKRGVHPPESLQAPSVELLRRFWQAAGGRVVLMTIAPELPQAIELIEEAVRLGIRVSLGHSNANTEEALAGIAAGATSATHTFNAMRPLNHREPGLLGVVLDERELFAELICDGIHVDPLLVRLFYRAKGEDRGILITDAMGATGMPNGVYRLGDLEVTVADGRCTYEGKLAGSTLTMDRAVRNFMRYTGASVGTAVKYASTNPAALMGLAASCGELSPGRPANIVVLSPEGEVRTTLLDGQVFRGPKPSA